MNDELHYIKTDNSLIKQPLSFKMKSLSDKYHESQISENYNNILELINKEASIGNYHLVCDFNLNHSEYTRLVEVEKFKARVLTKGEVVVLDGIACTEGKIIIEW